MSGSYILKQDEQLSGLNYEKTETVRRFAVIGAGPAGLSTALVLNERGHKVDLYDRADKIGGQLNMAAAIPGKEEFFEMLRYYTRQLELSTVDLKLGTDVSESLLIDEGYDGVIVATGVVPRDPKIPGQDHPKVLSYIDVLRNKAPVGKRVAIIGAGGIGFDVAEYLVHEEGQSSTMDLDEWLAEWGVVDPADARGGLSRERAQPVGPAREVPLLQRKKGKLGAKLGKTTGWIHRSSLKGGKMIGEVNYEQISDEGLLITFGDGRKDPTWLDVDNIIMCAGQIPLEELKAPLEAAGIPVHVIGGADVAAELDAKRAINQGSRIAAAL